ncbi:MAG: hypothetical protein E7585_06940 [Ruminococcaceae bacterium]|nr:hypothetical protein [Oscillospiraceae bacterium]
MGKGNRTRNERAESALVVASNRNDNKKKKGMPTWAGTAILVAVLAVLILVTTLTALSASGVFGRMRKTAVSENYEITVPMMSYLVSTEYQNLISMYNQYTSGSGSISIGAGEGGTALKSNGSYTLNDLREIPYTAVTDEKGKTVMTSSWFDYFAATAEKDALQILACCEAARGKMELSQEDIDNIQLELETLEMYANLYGTTTKGYLRTLYGEGVRLKDVRKMMELTQLAARWSERKADEFLQAVQDGDIDAYYEEHKDEFDLYCDYMGYTFTTTFNPSTKTEDEEKRLENEDLAQKYKDEQGRFAGYVEELIAATNKEDFTATLKAQLLAEEKIKMAKEKEKEVSELTDEEVAECDKKANIALLTATFENIKDNDKSGDLDTWLFESKTEGEGDDKVTTFLRKENDVKKIESATDVDEEGDDAYAKVSSTYSAYIYLGGMHRNRSHLRSVGHILFKSETYDNLTSSEKLTGKAKELADRLFERNKNNPDYKLTAYAMAGELLDTLFEEGKITEITREDGSKYYKIDEAVFEEYGELYTEDGSVFYDDVPVGQMVEEFEDWLFDASRVEGEISYPEPIKTTYGYHIMYYRGNEVEAWKSEIKNTIADESQAAYLNGLQEAYPVELRSKNLRFIVG